MIVHDVFGSRVIIQRVDRQVASVPGTLESAPRDFVGQHQMRVHPNGPGIEPTGDIVAAASVFGPHRSGEALRNIVGASDRIVFVGECFHGDDGAEDLLPGALGAVGDVDEDGRRHQVAGAGHGRTAGHHANTLFCCAVQVAQHPIEVCLGHDRAELDVVSGAGLADDEATDLRGEQLDELLGDALLDQDAAAAPHSCPEL